MIPRGFRSTQHRRFSVSFATPFGCGWSFTLFSFQRMQHVLDYFRSKSVMNLDWAFMMVSIAIVSLFLGSLRSVSRGFQGGFIEPSRVSGWFQYISEGLKGITRVSGSPKRGFQRIQWYLLKFKLCFREGFISFLRFSWRFRCIQDFRAVLGFYGVSEGFQGVSEILKAFQFQCLKHQSSIFIIAYRE